MALTLSGTNGVVGAGFTLDASGASVTAGVGTFGSVASSGAISGTTGTFSDQLTISTGSDSTRGLRVTGGASGGTEIAQFRTNNGTARFTVNNDVTVNTGNLVIGTSGRGIDFSNATDEASGESSTESILYDYEAGSFEPVLSTSGGSSSFSGNATYNGGYYVRIGRMVHISMNIRGTFTLGSGSGAVYITGLPFTSGATEELSGCGNAPYAFIGIPYHSGLVPSSGYTIGGGMVIPNSTTINVYQKIVSQASNPTVNPATNLSTSSDGINIHASGCYLAT